MFCIRYLGPCLAFFASVYAQTVDLGTAGTYAVVGTSAVTNTGISNIDGSISVFPGTAINGFPPGLFSGVEDAGDLASEAVLTDALAAYAEAAAATCLTDLTGQDLGGLVLLPGVYCFTSSAELTGTVTLDAQGEPDALFIFQIGSTLTTATGSQVLLEGGALACSVTWALGSSATLGTGTQFAGNILASVSITTQSGVTSAGGLYALNGAVTLIGSAVTAVGSCGTLNPPVSSTTVVSSSLPTTGASPPASPSNTVVSSPQPSTITILTAVITALASEPTSGTSAAFSTTMVNLIGNGCIQRPSCLNSPCVSNTQCNCPNAVCHLQGGYCIVDPGLSICSSLPPTTIKTSTSSSPTLKTTAMPDCNADGCYQGIIEYERSTPTETGFCSRYLGGDPTIPCPVAACGPRRISSACQCLVTMGY